MSTRVSIFRADITDVEFGHIGYRPMRRAPNVALIGVMLAALILIAVVAYTAWMRLTVSGNVETAESAGFAAAVKIGGPFTLTNHFGEKVTDSTYQGRFLLVYFGYGYCPDICTTELAYMAATLDAMGPAGTEVQPLFITLDPERDTFKFLSEYVTQFHSNFVGLTGTPAEIASVAKSYRVFYRRVESEEASEYLMDHSGFVYLMGPDGSFLTMFRGGTNPESIGKTIITYVQKGKARARN